MPTEWVDLEVEILRETPGAFLITDGENECWLPKSQTRLLGREGRDAQVQVPEWLALTEGLI
jgi:hypothetical protein